MNHSFNVAVAKDAGMLAATIFNSIGFWVEQNRANGTNFNDGRYWTYNSVKAWAELFPYASSSQVSRALSVLREKGYVVTANYNQNPYDRTLWYSLSDKGQREFYGESESEESISQICKMENPQPQNDYKESTDTNAVAKPISKGAKKRFIPPKPEEVNEYMTERGTPIDAERFCDYYESVGWMRGKTKLKDWRAAARQWARNDARWGKKNGVTWDADLEELAAALDF